MSSHPFIFTALRETRSRCWGKNSMSGCARFVRPVLWIQLPFRLPRSIGAAFQFIARFTRLPGSSALPDIFSLSIRGENGRLDWQSQLPPRRFGHLQRDHVFVYSLKNAIGEPRLTIQEPTLDEVQVQKF